MNTIDWIIIVASVGSLVGAGLMVRLSDQMRASALKIRDLADIEVASMKDENARILKLAGVLGKVYSCDMKAPFGSDFNEFASSLTDLEVFKLTVAGNAVTKGFRPESPEITPGNIAVFTANLHGEVSELWEAFRAGNLDEPCDKSEKMKKLGLPGLTCAEEEIADIMIRTLDTAHALDIDVAKSVAAKHLYNTTRPQMHGKKA